MTRVLALDTSTWWAGLALLERATDESVPEVVAELGFLARGNRTSHLLLAADRMLALAGWSRSSLDLFAATRGPGSFTGIRVGLGTLEGLALAADRPRIGVGTLPALAEAFGPAEGDRIPLLGAGRGEVYGARYDPDRSPPIERVAPWVLPLDRPVPESTSGPAIVFPVACEPPPPEGVLPATMRRAQGPRGAAAAAGRLALLLGAEPGAGSEPPTPIYVRSADARLPG